MSVDEALVEACRRAPDDDAHRLVWADAVGGERGELVVIQCELARGGLGAVDVAARRRRERELLAMYGAAWAGIDELAELDRDERDRPRPPRRGPPRRELPRLGGAFFGAPPQVEFRRGFAEALHLDLARFLAHGARVFERAPLLGSLTATGLTVEAGDPLGALRRLIDSPHLGRLRGLHLVGIRTREATFGGAGDDALRLLVERGAIERLDALGLSASDLSEIGLRHLAESRALGRLEKLWLPDGTFDGEALADVLSRVPRLRSLNVGATNLGAFAQVIPAVTELTLSSITDDALAALGRSPAAATIEALRLAGTLRRADGFDAFRRLHALDLFATRVGDLRADELAATLPSLRRLRISSLAPASALRPIALAFGPQLEELNLGRSGGRELGTIDELQPYVAGEVVGSEAVREPLL